MTDKKPFQLYDKPKFLIGDIRGGGNQPVQIFDGQAWLTYPSYAADLLKTARENGWGRDNGLPPVGKRMRTDVEGRPFLRLLIGRERGKNAATGATVPAMQFHLTWQIKAKGWESATAYFKTDQPDTGWEPCNFDTAKKYMIAHPVRLPQRKTKAGKGS